MITDPDLTARRAYESWHARHPVDSDADTLWHRMVKANLSVEQDLTGKRVLEIGCGRGGFSCWLAQQSGGPRQLVAADFSITAVQKGKHHAEQAGHRNITWEVADIQTIAHPDATFDTIISCETIEHVPDPRRALAEISRVLKPSGRLFLTTPNYLGMMGLLRLYCRLRGRVFTEEGQPINNCLLLPATRDWVRRAGLRVLLTRTVGHYFPIPGRPQIRMPIFDRAGVLTRWFGYHSVVVAEKDS